MDVQFWIKRLIFYSLIAIFTTLTAFKLFCSWFKKRGNYFFTNEHPKPKALSEWTDGFVQLKEVKLHYVEAGDKDKQTIIFVHGFPSFFYCWRHQLRHFQRDYHVVALDMRGYNESDKPEGIYNYTVEKISNDLIEVIEKFGSNVYLVGHDWGAAICWSVAKQRPEIIRKLAILNVPEPRAFREVITSNFKQLLASGYMFFFQSLILPEAFFRAEDYKLLINVMRRSVKDPEHFTDEDAECYKYALSGNYGLTGPINWYRAAGTTLLDNKHQDDGKVKTKTLIIWGAKDTALTVETAQASVKYCEDVELKIIPNGSHFVQEDEPNQVNEYLEAYLRE